MAGAGQLAMKGNKLLILAYFLHLVFISPPERTGNFNCSNCTGFLASTYSSRKRARKMYHHEERSLSQGTFHSMLPLWADSGDRSMLQVHAMLVSIFRGKYIFRLTG